MAAETADKQAATAQAVTSAATIILRKPVRSTYTPSGDYWDSLPAALLGYGHVAGEVLLPLFPHYTKYLSAVTMVYVGMSSVDRGNRAAKLEPHPELRRYNGMMAGFESAFGGWVSLITLPSMALGFVTGPVAAAFQSRSATLPPLAVRYGPAAVTAGLLPIVMTACRYGAEWALDFAVRPVIDSNRPEVLSGPRPDYEAPSAEDILGLGILPDLDPADRAKLRWALDGDPTTPYPDEGASRGAGAPATAAEDAAFLASLQDYAARVEAAKARGAAGGPGAAAGSDSDYDRIVAQAVDSASGGRLSRARATVAAASPAGEAPSAAPTTGSGKQLQ